MLVVVRLVGWLVTPLPCFFPALLSAVSLLAFCNFTTCSFSRLFSSSSSAPAIKKVESQSNMKYNAPGGMVKRSSTFSQFPTEKSKTFDFLNEEWVTWIHTPKTLEMNGKCYDYNFIFILSYVENKLEIAVLAICPPIKYMYIMYL